jgi:hypothetical protein
VSVRSRTLTFLIGIAFILGGVFFSGTLAQTITLGSGQVEFGQGTLLVTNCDPTVFAQPIPTATGGNPAYLLQGFSFWGINVSDCNNRDFIIRLYGDSGQVNLSSGISEAKVRLLGSFFYSLTPGMTIYPGDAQGYFALDIDEPNLDANALKKVTLDSEKAGDFADCAPTYASVGNDSSVTFSEVGACLFTAPVSRQVTVVVTGGGGGGGGGEYFATGTGGGGGGGGGGQVESTTVTMNAGNKYVILVGTGGSGGDTSTTRGSDGSRGGISGAFGARAQPGEGGQGAGSSTGEDGTTKCSGVGTSRGGFGGSSGSARAGGAKSCSSGGSGGGSAVAAGSTSSSSTGATGGAAANSPISSRSLGAGGSGGNGSSGSTTGTPTTPTDYGKGGTGGDGAGSGGGASKGGNGASGLVELRYTP